LHIYYIPLRGKPKLYKGTRGNILASVCHIWKGENKIVHLLFISRKSKTKHRINLVFLLYRAELEVRPERGFSLPFPKSAFYFSVTTYQSLQHLSLFLPLATSLDLPQRILLTHSENRNLKHLL